MTNIDCKFLVIDHMIYNYRMLPNLTEANLFILVYDHMKYI